jgi:hypothetical protein
MKINTQRQFLAMAFAILGISSVSAQVITIDWSDLSAVTITGTGQFASNDQFGSKDYSEGVTLEGFFTTAINNDSSVASTSSSSSLYTAGNTGEFLNDLITWDHLTGDGASTTDDLNIYRSGSIITFDFRADTAAFTGSSSWDLSNPGASIYTDYFPALNVTGSVYAGNSTVLIGTWQIVGATSAVPEPSSFAAILGIIALCGTVGARRRTRRA